MEVNDCLVKLLGRKAGNWPVVEHSDFDVCAGVMAVLVLVTIDVLSHDFLYFVLSQLLEALVRHVVVRVGLLHRQRLGEHGNVDLQVGVDAVEDNLGAFFNELVVVDQVEENEHGLVVVSVRGHPVSELVTSVIRANLVKSSVRHHGKALAKGSLFLQTLEHSCASCHNSVHRET